MTNSSNPLRLEYGRAIDGLRVVRQPAPVGAASFSATYVGPAGSGFDPPGEEGIARLVNQLMTVAAGRYRRIELARRLDRAGALLSHETSPEAGEVTIRGPAGDWKSLVGLLGEVVRSPGSTPTTLLDCSGSFSSGRCGNEPSRRVERTSRCSTRSILGGTRTDRPVSGTGGRSLDSHGSA